MNSTWYTDVPGVFFIVIEKSWTDATDPLSVTGTGVDDIQSFQDIHHEEQVWELIQDL